MRCRVPEGSHLLVANRRADAISGFDVNTDTRRLTYTGPSADVPNPTTTAVSPLDHGVITPSGRGSARVRVQNKRHSYRDCPARSVATSTRMLRA
ncbi:hypothetical protein GGP50_000549 [Salinibacter ruber]|uniref:Uncharacterized protein n=1 Tax=Salinibacter ruber TaxID=146919 RepID=A0A9X2R116_9BACT|nr:hypothetical protein [Salinibacter ruber]MCS3612756.1 hypothetical protein [Salinibacter ruber]MCS3616213.1 hypothetical protein [Salinibacter ruber]MCS3626587.1 hypothetical protein [Salinibacter ruber]MCS3648624.1 hypothetical protein [Salinibacter ruber]